MYHLTRAATTLVGAAVPGVLLWLATQTLSTDGASSTGEYWGAVGLVSLAGLTMALSQLLGGWTKWGWPRLSLRVFLIAFLPVLIVGGWMLAAGTPGDDWLGSHVRNWSGDLGISGLVDDLTTMVPAISFGVGLVFGFTFDTTGPRVREERPATAETTPGRTTPTERREAADERTRDRDGERVEPEREREPVAVGDRNSDERRVRIHHVGDSEERPSED